MASVRPGNPAPRPRTAPARPAAPLSPPGRPARSTRPARRHLTVLPGGRQDSVAEPEPRRGVGIRFIAMATAVVSALVFGVVLLHVMLAQSSFELQRVHEKLVTEETRFRQMRFEVATAEAPARIHEAAANIGLVVPGEQRYVYGPEGGPGSISNAQTPKDKTELKAVLSRQP